LLAVVVPVVGADMVMRVVMVTTVDQMFDSLWKKKS